MLGLKKTKEHLSVTRDEELVPKDYHGQKVKEFEADLSKLMDVSDGEDLNESYLGKKKLTPVASKGNLARIMESYKETNHEESF